MLLMSRVPSPLPTARFYEPARDLRTIHCKCCSKLSIDTTKRRSLILGAAAFAIGLLQPLHSVTTAQTAFLDEGNVENQATLQKLDGKLAAALTASVYYAVQDLQVMTEEDFQREVYKLRQREFKYYYEAYKQQLAPVPDLSDNGGAVTNPVYFNFIYYILWKVVAMRVTDPVERCGIVHTAGRELAASVAQDALELVSTSAHEGHGKAAPGDLLHALHLALLHFQDGRYCRDYALVWQHLDPVPQDEVLIQDTREASLAAAGVAAPAGVPPGETIDDRVAGVEAGKGAFESGPVYGDVVFQLRVTGLVDMNGAAALRAEENGFCGAPLFGVLSCIVAAAGYNKCRVEEYILKDEFKPPDYYIIVDPLYVIPTLPASTAEPKILLQNWSIH